MLWTVSLCSRFVEKRLGKKSTLGLNRQKRRKALLEFSFLLPAFSAMLCAWS